MPRVGFETTIPLFELSTTTCALDRVTTGISSQSDSYGT